MKYRNRESHLIKYDETIQECQRNKLITLKSSGGKEVPDYKKHTKKSTHLKKSVPEKIKTNVVLQPSVWLPKYPQSAASNRLFDSFPVATHSYRSHDALTIVRHRAVWLTCYPYYCLT